MGGLAVSFLITGDDSNGTIAPFELTVAASQRSPAPAQSHDHCEETVYGTEGVLTRTVDGKKIEVGPDHVGQRDSACTRTPQVGSLE